MFISAASLTGAGGTEPSPDGGWGTESRHVLQRAIRALPRALCLLRAAGHFQHLFEGREGDAEIVTAHTASLRP